jgi:hypothetical protein
MKHSRRRSGVVIRRKCKTTGGRHFTVADVITNPTLARDLCGSTRQAALEALTTATAAVAAHRPDDDAHNEHGGAAGAATWNLGADQAATILSVTRRWLFRHKHLPFVRLISRKKLVCDEAKLRAWIASRKAA